VKLPSLKLALLRATRATHLTQLMLDLLFTREEMASSSVTGRCYNKFGYSAKKPLDASKLAALIGKCIGKLHLCVVFIVVVSDAIECVLCVKFKLES
jgi:hypothetical protein